MPWPLGVAQMTSWGTMYYSFSLFFKPMQTEFGWSQVAINGALTCGLLMTGLMSYPVGALLDRYGGRWLMTLGSFGCGCLLLLWSRIETLPQLYGLWIALGVCLAGCLIEPLFAVVNQTFGATARPVIVAVTLVTGLAGTVYVPLIGYLIPQLGWRSTLVVLALLNLSFNALVHWAFIPPRAPATRTPGSLARARGRVIMRRRLRNPVFWGLVLWYTSYSLTASSLVFQLVPLLRAEEVPDRLIFLAFALIGPIQVIARVVTVTVARRASSARLGAWTSSMVPLAVLTLIVAPHDALWLGLFSTFFAIGHGITTILRGTAPIEWLGREHSARTMGALALPMMFAMAVAPSLTALVWSATGSSRIMLWGIFFGSALGTLGYWIAVLSRRARFTARQH